MDFMTLEQAEVKLEKLENDPKMITLGRYSPLATEWPDNHMPFCEIHMAYLRKNKSVNPAHYLSNLELMIRNTSSHA